MIFPIGKRCTTTSGVGAKTGLGRRFTTNSARWLRVSEGRSASASAAILDSQSVATATMIAQAVGIDGGKRVKGRKRHVLVDTLGLVLMVVVTAANVSEQAGAKLVFAKVHQLRQHFSRLICIWVDGGYQGKEFMEWVMDTYRWIVEVVLRPEGVRGFVVIRERWKVERTFGWFNWWRRLSKEYEVLPETTEAFIYIGMIRLMLRRLA